MSTDTVALVAFLQARIADDEQTARATMWDGSNNTDAWQLSASATVDTGGDEFYAGDRTVAHHIVCHDPARVLREVAAKRKLLDRYERLLRSKEAHAVAEAELNADMAHHEQTGEWAGAGFPDVRLRALRREDDYLTAMLPVLEGLVRAAAAVYPDSPEGLAEAVGEIA